MKEQTGSKGVRPVTAGATGLLAGLLIGALAALAWEARGKLEAEAEARRERVLRLSQAVIFCDGDGVEEAVRKCAADRGLETEVLAAVRAHFRRGSDEDDGVRRKQRVNQERGVLRDYYRAKEFLGLSRGGDPPSRSFED